MEFGDGGDLGDGDVVERSEGTEHGTAEEQRRKIEVLGDERKREAFVGCQTTEVGQLEEHPRQPQREPERCQRAGEGNGGGRPEPMRQVEADEGDGRCGDHGDEQRVMAVEDRRSNEADEHHDRRRHGHQGEPAPEPAEADHHDGEQGHQPSEDGPPVLIGEEVGVRRRLVPDDDLIPDRHVGWDQPGAEVDHGKGDDGPGLVTLVEFDRHGSTRLGIVVGLVGAGGVFDGFDGRRQTLRPEPDRLGPFGCLSLTFAGGPQQHHAEDRRQTGGGDEDQHRSKGSSTAPGLPSTCESVVVT